MGYITATMAIMAPTKISESFASIIKDIIAAPITRKGALTTSLISIWFTSLDILVTKAGVPSASISL